MPNKTPLIELKAAEAGYETSPKGVVALLNDLLPECASDSELARRLGLSSPSYLFHYSQRKGITIVAPTSRVATLKDLGALSAVEQKNDTAPWRDGSATLAPTEAEAVRDDLNEP